MPLLPLLQPIFYGIPWPSMVFYRLPCHYITFYDLTLLSRWCLLLLLMTFHDRICASIGIYELLWLLWLSMAFHECIILLCITLLSMVFNDHPWSSMEIHYLLCMTFYGYLDGIILFSINFQLPSISLHGFICPCMTFYDLI